MCIHLPRSEECRKRLLGLARPIGRGIADAVSLVMRARISCAWMLICKCAAQPSNSSLNVLLYQFMLDTALGMRITGVQASLYIALLSLQGGFSHYKVSLIARIVLHIS